MAGERILVVEDEGDLVDSLKERLEGQGYRVFAALDGTKALELVQRVPPHLILLDLMLPKLDGYRILKFLKANPRYQGIPILVITARADDVELGIAQELGAVGCFVKPLSLEALLAKVRNVLKGEGSPCEE